VGSGFGRTMVSVVGNADFQGSKHERTIGNEMLILPEECKLFDTDFRLLTPFDSHQ